MVVDQEQARFDPDSGTVEMYVLHESFAQPDELTPEELKELRIKQAAIRIAAGLELRPLRVIAKEVGCRHQAIDNALKRICTALRIRKFHVSDETRQRQREARLAAVAAADAPR